MAFVLSAQSGAVQLRGGVRFLYDIINMLYLFRLENELENDSCQCGTCKRSDDEYPYLVESYTTLENCRSKASGRINRGTCERNSNDMNKGESQTDNDT